MSVTLIGTSKGTNTAAPVAHAIGDIIVIAAFRATTGTPALPAGYQSIIIKTGTTSSIRVGYRIATATNDVGGTWTNATATVCHVYRTSLYSTGGSVTIGTSASNSSSTNTVNYPALTLFHADGTSWVLGFAGVDNTTETIQTNPVGLTNQSVQNSATDSCAGFDTTAAVSSWSSVNATTTGAAGHSVSCTIELIENQPGAAISNIIQHVSYAYNSSIAGPAGNNYVYTIPNATLANNGLVLAVAYPNGVTPAITDDQSNTWPASGAAGTVTSDAGAGGMVIQIFRLASAATGTQKITVGFGSTVTQPVKVWITELYNITGTINSTTAWHAEKVNAGGIVSPGSQTPTDNNVNGGNLILSYMIDASTNGTTNPALIIPETSYSLNDADVGWTQGQGSPNASQFWLQATSAATTPRFYLNIGGAETYNVAAIALSVGVQGTAKPAGIHIDRMCYFANTSNAAKWLLQIPSTGNLGYVQGFMSTTSAPVITSVVDSDVVTWTQVNSTTGEVNPYFRPNYTGGNPSGRTLTINLSTGTGLVTQLIYYDISGAAASPLDTFAATADASFNNVSSIAAQPSITPSGTNELIIGFMQIAQGPSSGITVPSGAVYDLPTYQIWQGTGTIAVATLTVSATAWGAVFDGPPGSTISGAGVTPGTSIQSGTGPTYTIQPSPQTVSVGETMNQANPDGDTMALGNAAFHWYNGSTTSAQSVTYSISNQASNSGTSIAVAFKAAVLSGGGAAVATLFAPNMGPSFKLSAKLMSPNLAYPPAVTITVTVTFTPGSTLPMMGVG